MAKNYIFPEKFLGRGLPLGLICFLFILGQNGCGITTASKSPRRLKEPVPPLVGEAATRLYQQTRSKCDNVPPVESVESGKNEVSELVLTCVSTGQDFYEPKGSAGFVLRVTLLDGHYQTVQTAANITIILYGAQGVQAEQDRNTSGKYRKVPPKYRKAPSGRPLRLWYVPANELADYWMPSRLLNGFLFRLEWTREVPPGDYILSVIYERQNDRLGQKSTVQEEGRRVGQSPTLQSQNGTQTICQEVFFCK